MNRIGLIVLLASSLLSAMERPQSMVDKKTVDVEKGFMGTKFKQEGHAVLPNSMYEVLSQYPESKDAASASKMWMYPGMGLAALGGGLMGYMAVQPLVGGDFNTPVFLAGAGMAAAAMIIGKVAENKLVEAVGAYNGVHGRTGLQLQLHPAGAGFAVTFRLGKAGG